MIKYCLHPGWVYSKNDGDEHWISYNQLIQLYHLDPRDCVNYAYIWDRGHSEYIHLYPRLNGDYCVRSL